MADNLTLATAFVDFQTKGFEQLMSKIDLAKQWLNPGGHEAGGKGRGRDFNLGPAVGLGAGALAIGTAVTGVMALTHALKSLAMTGLQVTAEFVMLRFEFTQLSFSMAGILLPTINAISDGVQRLTRFFYSLNATQQDAFLAGTGMLSQLGDTFSEILESAKPVLTVLGAAFRDLFAGMKPVLVDIGHSFAQLISASAPLVNFVVRFGGLLSKVMFQFEAGIFKAAAAIMTYLEPTFVRLTAFVAAMDSLVTVLVDGLSAAFDALGVHLGNVFKLALRAIEEDFNVMIANVVTMQVLLDGLKHGKILSPVNTFLQALHLVHVAMDAISKKSLLPGAAGRTITPGLGSFEDISQQFKRIQEAPAVARGKNDQERAADAAEKILQFLEQKGVNPGFLGTIPPIV